MRKKGKWKIKKKKRPTTDILLAIYTHRNGNNKKKKKTMWMKPKENTENLYIFHDCLCFSSFFLSFTINGKAEENESLLTSWRLGNYFWFFLRFLPFSSNKCISDIFIIIIFPHRKAKKLQENPWNGSNDFLQYYWMSFIGKIIVQK